MYILIDQSNGKTNNMWHLWYSRRWGYYESSVSYIQNMEIFSPYIEFKSPYKFLVLMRCYISFIFNPVFSRAAAQMLPEPARQLGFYFTLLSK